MNKKNVPFDPAWRARAKWKRVFYARYMKWLEWLGFAVVAAVIGGFIFAFNYRVDDVVKADGIELRFAGTDVTAEMDGYVGRVLVEDFSPVTKGQPVMELMPLIPTSPAMQVLASADGTFVKAAEGRVAAGDVIYRLVDTSKVVFNATLSGDSVARTQIGQTARLKDISIGSGATTLRINVDSGQGHLVTRETGSALTLEGLGDYAVHLRDDQPLAVNGIKSAEVDIDADLQHSDEPAMPVNPGADEMVTGRVETATPIATVQVSQLPEALQKAFLSQLEASLKDRPIGTEGGLKGIPGNLRNLKAVLKLNASGEPAPGAQLLSGTKVDRTCEVDVVLDNPPASIIDSLRAGRKVAAKVEVVTGNRPIAFILLKRS